MEVENYCARPKNISEKKRRRLFLCNIVEINCLFFFFYTANYTILSYCLLLWLFVRTINVKILKKLYFSILSDTVYYLAIVIIYQSKRDLKFVLFGKPYTRMELKYCSLSCYEFFFVANSFLNIIV